MDFDSSYGFVFTTSVFNFLVICILTLFQLIKYTVIYYKFKFRM